MSTEQIDADSIIIECTSKLLELGGKMYSKSKCKKELSYANENYTDNNIKAIKPRDTIASAYADFAKVYVSAYQRLSEDEFKIEYKKSFIEQYNEVKWNALLDYLKKTK